MQPMTTTVHNGNEIAWMPITTGNQNHFVINAPQPFVPQGHIQHQLQPQVHQHQLYQRPVVHHVQHQLPAQVSYQAIPTPKRTHAATNPSSKKRKVTSDSKGEASNSQQTCSTIPRSSNATEVLRKRYYPKSKRQSKKTSHAMPQPTVQNIPNFLHFHCPMPRDIDEDKVGQQPWKDIPLQHQPESMLLAPTSDTRFNEPRVSYLTKEDAIPSNKYMDELFSKALGIQLTHVSQDLVDVELQKLSKELGDSAITVSEQSSFPTKSSQKGLAAGLDVENQVLVPQFVDTLLDQDLVDITKELGIALSQSLTYLISEQACPKDLRSPTEQLENTLQPVTTDYVLNQELSDNLKFDKQWLELVSDLGL